MKNKAIVLLCSALLSGCTATNVTKRADGTFSIFRLSLGTNPAIDFHATHADGTKYDLGYTHEQADALNKALDTARALTPR